MRDTVAKRLRRKQEIFMRDTVAKRLRRKYIGDYSIRFTKYSTAPNTGHIDLGPRGRYRQAKKKYYQSRKRR